MPSCSGGPCGCAGLFRRGRGSLESLGDRPGGEERPERLGKARRGDRPERDRLRITLFDALERRLDSYTKATTSIERLRALGEIREVEWRWAQSRGLPASNAARRSRIGSSPRDSGWFRRSADWSRAWPGCLRPRAKRRGSIASSGCGSSRRNSTRRWGTRSGSDGRPQTASPGRDPRGPERARRPQSRGPLAPGAELEAAIDNMFQVPNFLIRMDLATISPIIEKDLVPTGPIERRRAAS